MSWTSQILFILFFQVVWYILSLHSSARIGSVGNISRFILKSKLINIFLNSAYFLYFLFYSGFIPLIYDFILITLFLFETFENILMFSFFKKMVKNNIFFLHNLFGLFLHISFGFLLACLQLTDLLHAIHIRTFRLSIALITCDYMCYNGQYYVNNIWVFYSKQKSYFTILYNLVEIALRMFV